MLHSWHREKKRSYRECRHLLEEHSHVLLVRVLDGLHVRAQNATAALRLEYWRNLVYGLEESNDSGRDPREFITKGSGTRGSGDASLIRFSGIKRATMNTKVRACASFATLFKP